MRRWCALRCDVAGITSICFVDFSWYSLPSTRPLAGPLPIPPCRTGYQRPGLTTCQAADDDDDNRARTFSSGYYCGCLPVRAGTTRMDADWSAAGCGSNFRPDEDVCLVAVNGQASQAGRGGKRSGSKSSPALLLLASPACAPPCNPNPCNPNPCSLALLSLQRYIGQIDDDDDECHYSISGTTSRTTRTYSVLCITR